ncbi:DUF2157 domain-containing protein [Phycicoccus sp. CSK15P-2]|uniref:DUF2157 domain-containing protein n=1 Tax=Phycicoccus sp. CSK15P-2 TaxID=2807627 RepID=UPI00194FF717|nr:DUF2157 domain-containing protein [Phycicoccus sp. CSK15P-2]MBM6402910.1 DUF2157 domain-containing protein [Phycicoccus sp. CSK15P-2]
MTAPPTTTTDPVPPGPGDGSATAHPATPAQLAWLEGELPRWQAEGLVDATAVAAIRGRYVAHRRFTLARIVLTLGAAFVGLGLVWLVAANLDALPPALRFAVVAAVWLGLTAGAELLATRKEHGGGVASPVVGAVRLLAAGAFGAVVFQAAQSLQVPAYEPLLVGVWALGVLAYAYAVAGIGPVVLGVVLGAYWLVWHVVSTADDVVSVLLAVGAAGLASVAVGVLHHRLAGGAGVWRSLGLPWREVGAVLVLGGLFAAALPYAAEVELGAPLPLVVLGLAALLAGLAVLRGDRLDRLEVGLATGATVLVVLLAVWRADEDPTSTADLAVGDWARAAVAVGVYLLVASGYAVLGGMRDSGRLTWLATAALVVFVTTQALAVFAPILSGAWLFLLVGVVLLATGVLADRGRRRLAAQGREVLS